MPASYRFKILPWSNIARGISLIFYSCSHQGSDNIYRLSVILNTLECELMFCKIYCNLASKPCTPWLMSKSKQINYDRSHAAVISKPNLYCKDLDNVKSCLVLGFVCVVFRGIFIIKRCSDHMPSINYNKTNWYRDRINYHTA